MELKDQSVTVQITKALKERISKLSPSSTTVILDSNTKRYCYPTIQHVIGDHNLIELSPGEAVKNLEGATIIWGGLTKYQVDRKGLVIVLGGGVLGDMGGFCAATYKRGIPFILIPTTLLAQVDASTGGKLAIDFEHFKNHIGIFQEPYETLIDTQFLSTLPEREVRSGYAEVIKHCLISDKNLWIELQGKVLNQLNWDQLVSHSVRFKKRITTEDPRESGLRKILNFGHTIGHAIESSALSQGNPILHGEAIAAGMICESFIAKQKGLINESELKEITTYLHSIFGHLQLQLDTTNLIELMIQDKKNQNQKILMSLINGIGHCVWDVETSTEEIQKAMDYYFNRV